MMSCSLPRFLVALIPLVLLTAPSLRESVSAAPNSVPPVVATELPADAIPATPQDLTGLLRQEVCEGAKIVLLSPQGEHTVLTQDFESACRADVSFDGRRILFSGRKTASDFWNVFEMELETRSVRQVTRDMGNCRSPIYLSELFTLDSPEPWNTLAFASDGANEIDPLTGLPSESLYSCRLDGTEMRRLTYNPSSDRDPFLVWDGRVIYSTAQHSTLEHEAGGRVSLFSIYQDGTDVSPFFVHEGARIKQMPTVTDQGVCLFIETEPGTPDGSGALARFDLARPSDSYRRLTSNSDGGFHSPSPLFEGQILVSHRAASDGATFEVGRFDPDAGRYTAIHTRPGVHLLHAQPVQARVTPDGRSTVVDESRPNGEIYLISIGINGLANSEWLTPGMSRRLRLLEALPITQHEQGSFAFPRKRILGEAPIEEDGSFFIEVPANLTLQLQILDEEGMALQTCDWIWVKNREARGCIGCHEDPMRVPPNQLPDAVRRPSNRLTLPPQRRRTVEFRRDVAPVLEQRCSTASCHGGDAGLDLRRRPGEPPADYSRRLYDALTTAPVNAVDPRLGRWVHPGRARTSPLVWHVLGRKTLRPWDEEVETDIPVEEPRKLEGLEARTLIEWIDLGAHPPQVESGEQEGGTQ